MHNKRSLTIFMLTLTFFTILALITGKKIEHALNKSQLVQEQYYLNPIYNEIVGIGEEFGFDFSFASYLPGGGIASITNRPIWGQPEHSLDLLLFGDSSLTDNLSEYIFSRFSGYKAAFLGVPCTLPREQLILFAEKAAKRFLKADGLLGFSFNTWEKNTFCNNQKNELDSLVENGDVDSLVKRAQNFRKSTVLELFTTKSYEHYNMQLQSFLDNWFFGKYFHLPALSLYDDFIEPFYAPNLNDKKMANRAVSRDKYLYKWHENDPNHFWYIKEAKARVAFPRNSGPDASVSSSIAQARFDALKTISWPNKFVIVPFHEDPVRVQQLRWMFAKHLANIDVFDTDDQFPVGRNIEYQGAAHMANASGAYISLKLAQWVAAKRKVKG